MNSAAQLSPAELLKQHDDRTAEAERLAALTAELQARVIQQVASVSLDDDAAIAALAATQTKLGIVPLRIAHLEKVLEESDKVLTAAGDAVRSQAGPLLRNQIAAALAEAVKNLLPHFGDETAARAAAEKTAKVEELRHRSFALDSGGSTKTPAKRLRDLLEALAQAEASAA